MGREDTRIEREREERREGEGRVEEGRWRGSKSEDEGEERGRSVWERMRERECRRSERGEGIE